MCDDHLQQRKLISVGAAHIHELRGLLRVRENARQTWDVHDRLRVSIHVQVLQKIRSRTLQCVAVARLQNGNQQLVRVDLFHLHDNWVVAAQTHLSCEVELRNVEVSD